MMELTDMVEQDFDLLRSLPECKPDVQMYDTYRAYVREHLGEPGTVRPYFGGMYELHEFFHWYATMEVMTDVAMLQIYGENGWN